MSFREENKLLEAFGCKEAKYDFLVNNYCIKFIYNDKKFIAEHILNIYGEAVDFWELEDKRFDTLEELLNYIK